jgi:diacylglycerol kinase (ATP)
MNKIKEFFVSRGHSFRYAAHGWGYVVRTQRNAWIHAFFTVAVILMAAWLRLPLRDWAVLLLTIGLVWTAEFINTAIEAVVDLASPEQHPLAKVGKDVGAGAVLVAAAASILVGLLILGPPLWEKVTTLFLH